MSYRHFIARLMGTAPLNSGLIMKLIYWKNDVIRNDVIFHDGTRCSMATISLWGFNVLIIIFIIVCSWYKGIIFTFVSVRGGSVEYHALLFMYKSTSIRDLYRAQVGQGFKYLFSVIRSLIMFQKQMNRLSKENDAHIRTHLEGSTVVTKQDIRNFLESWNEKGRREVTSLFLSKKVENSCIGTAKSNNIDIIYSRRNLATTIFTLYGPYQLWVHQ